MHLVQAKFVSAQCLHHRSAISHWCSHLCVSLCKLFYCASVHYMYSVHYTYTGVHMCALSLNFPTVLLLCTTRVHVHTGVHMCALSLNCVLLCTTTELLFYCALYIHMCALSLNLPICKLLFVPPRPFTAFQVNAQRPGLILLKAPLLIMPPWHEPCKKRRGDLNIAIICFLVEHG